MDDKRSSIPATPTFATSLFMSPAFAGHDTGSHPENPGRFAAIRGALESSGLLVGRQLPKVEPARDEQITRVHSERHLQGLEAIVMQGGGWIDQDTVVDVHSLEIARFAAGAGIAAVDHVLAANEGQRHAFALGRPPGHHATPDRAMGFCLLNSIAISAAHALDSGLERVAIIDWDVHHGNGTQEAFYGRNDLFFCSIHQWPLYPGSGASNERGAGTGEGWTLNLPLPAGSDDLDYLEVFDRAVAPAVRAARPQLILVSAGYDAHKDDPLGGMAVTTNGFRVLTQRVSALADESCEGRLVFVLEGGYDLAALTGSILASIAELDQTQCRSTELQID